MFFDDHKRAMTIIRGKRSAKGERVSEPTAMKPEHVQTEPGVVDGRHTAMQDFLAAHQEGSPQKMAEALSNFMTIHSAPSESSSSES